MPLSGTSEDAAGYLVSLGGAGGAEGAAVLERLGDARTALEARLTRRARLELGFAFVVEIRDLRQDDDVHAVIGLKAVYGRASAEGDIAKLLAFSNSLREEFGQALEGYVARDEIDVVCDPAHAAKAASWERVAPIVATIATGIGAVGVATFVGGAVQYARFAGAKLPAAEAVSLTPTQSLIVLGAGTLTQTLIPAVFCALLWAGISLLTVPHSTLHRGRAVSERFRRVVFFVFVCAADLVVLFLFGLPATINIWRFAGLVLLAITLPVVGILIARRTSRDGWLTATAFVAVVGFATALIVIQSWDTPEVRGAAIVREHKRALVGLYIAENHDRVYLGQHQLSGTSAEAIADNPDEIDPARVRIIGVNKKEISDVAFGSAKGFRDAYLQAVELAERLCERQVPRNDSKRPGGLPTSRCWTVPAGELAGALRKR